MVYMAKIDQRRRYEILGGYEGIVLSIGLPIRFQPQIRKWLGVTPIGVYNFHQILNTKIFTQNII